MEGHKRQSNYELQSENRAWKEDEIHLGEGRLCCRCGKGSKKAQQIPQKVKETFEVLEVAEWTESLLQMALPPHPTPTLTHTHTWCFFSKEAQDI